MATHRITSGRCSVCGAAPIEATVEGFFVCPSDADISCMVDFFREAHGVRFNVGPLDVAYGGHSAWIGSRPLAWEYRSLGALVEALARLADRGDLGETGHRVSVWSNGVGQHGADCHDCYWAGPTRSLAETAELDAANHDADHGGQGRLFVTHLDGSIVLAGAF